MKRQGCVARLSLLLVGLLIVAGCSSSGSGGNDPGAANRAASITIVSGTDIQQMDIHKVNDSPSFTVLQHVNETLFSITADGKVEPLLAESFTQSQGGKKITITLKKGVKFSDGTPFNAEAVKKNLDRIMNPETKSAFGFLLGSIDKVTAVDNETVEIDLKTPFAPLQYVLGHGFTGMISPAVLDGGADAMATSTVGTGPYLVKEWKKGESVTLERNDKYWGTKAKTTELVFKMVKEDGPRMVEIESGTADVALRVPPSEMARLQAIQDIEIRTTPGLRTIFIYFNVTKPPLDNVKVRQAINYAVDKDAIVKSILNGMGRVSDAPIAPAIFGYSKQQPYAYNQAKAKELLKSAGLENGFTIELLHPNGRYPQDARVAEAVAAQLKEVGIEVKLRTMEWADYVPFTGKPQAENEVQMAMLGWSTPTMDADYGLFSLFHSSAQAPAGFNRGFYNSGVVDSSLNLGRTDTLPANRQYQYSQAIQAIWQDAPWLFLYSEVQVDAIRKNVIGIEIHPSERLVATQAEKAK